MIRILVALCVVAVFTVMELPNQWRTNKMAEVAHRQTQGEVIDPQELAVIRKGPVISQWWANMSKANAVFNMTELNKERRVLMRVEVPFESVLNPQEAMPERVFRETYLAARTPAHMAGMCAELLATIASKCQVTRPRGRLKEGGMAEMSAQLRFVPKTHPGEMIPDALAEVIPVKMRFKRGHKLANTPKGRTELLQAIADYCDAVRDMTGTCVITDVRLENDADSFFKVIPLMDVRFDLAFMGDPETADVDAVRALFKEFGAKVTVYSRRNKS